MLSGHHAWYGRIHLPAFHSYHNFLLSPGIEKITEQETAHPSLHQLSQLTGAAVAANGAMENITVSHEIEERATALVQADDDDEDNHSEETEKESVDQGAFHSDPIIIDVPSGLVTVTNKCLLGEHKSLRIPWSRR